MTFLDLLVIVSEGLMLPPFVYWAWLSATGKTVHPRWMAAVNPLTLYVVLSVGKVILSDGAFRICPRPVLIFWSRRSSCVFSEKHGKN